MRFRDVVPLACLVVLQVGCRVSERPDRAPIRIVATDRGFALPDTVAAGLSHVVFENAGSDIHEVMFVKLPDGMSGDDYLEAVRGGQAFPEGALDYAGPGLTSPGEVVEMWLQLDPGTYLLACWFRGHLESIAPHIMTVSENGSGAIKPPHANAVLRLIDYRFELVGELAAGPQVLRIETPGPSLHEVDFFRLHEGRTLEDLKRWQKGGKAGPPPGDAIGGVLDYHEITRTVWLKIVLRPGRYVLWCGMDMVPDAEGPAGDVTHADAGMFMELEVPG